MQDVILMSTMASVNIADMCLQGDCLPINSQNTCFTVVLIYLRLDITIQV